MGGDWRQGFEYAWQQPNSEPDEGPGLTWRQLAPRHWSGTWETKIRGTVTATLKAGSPHHRRPVDTVEDAQVATDEVWAAR